jgi:uncharacterized protein (TIGR03067 family)
VKKHVLLVFVAGLLIAADEKEDAKQDAKKLQGKWTVTKAVENGNEVPEEQAKNIKVAFKEGKVTYTDDNGEHTATFKLDPGKKPKEIDVVPQDGENKGQTMKGIYSLEKNTLKMCVAFPGKDRPTEFTSKQDSSHLLVEMKREES